MRGVLAMLAMMTTGCDGVEGGAAGAAQQARAAPAGAAAPAICGEGADGAAPSADAVRALGRPATETRFTLADEVTEFRVKLLNHFTLPRDAAVAILEQTWADGPCRLTIWSAERDGTTRPVDWLRWNEGDEF